MTGLWPAIRDFCFNDTRGAVAFRVLAARYATWQCKLAPYITANQLNEDEANTGARRDRTRKCERRRNQKSNGVFAFDIPFSLEIVTMLRQDRNLESSRLLPWSEAHFKTFGIQSISVYWNGVVACQEEEAITDMWTKISRWMKLDKNILPSNTIPLCAKERNFICQYWLGRHNGAHMDE